MIPSRQPKYKFVHGLSSLWNQNCHVSWDILIYPRYILIYPVHSHISLCFYTVSLHSTGHNWPKGNRPLDPTWISRHGGRLETQDLDDGWPGGQVAMAQRWGSRWSRWGMDALFSSFMSEVSNIKTAKMKKLWTESECAEIGHHFTPWVQCLRDGTVSQEREPRP